MLTEFVGGNKVAAEDAADRSHAAPTLSIDYITVIPSLDKPVPGSLCAVPPVTGDNFMIQAHSVALHIVL